jgi:hypothetical protein
MEAKGVSVSVGLDTAPDDPQVELEPLEKSRVELATERHPNGSVTVSRDDLYTLVWAEPMTTVAARFGVSANYLSRGCDHPNVPHPNRGYWAKLTVGKAARPMPLPLARPGEVLQWTKGTGVPRASQAVVAWRLGQTSGCTLVTLPSCYLSGAP